MAGVNCSAGLDLLLVVGISLEGQAIAAKENPAAGYYSANRD